MVPNLLLQSVTIWKRSKNFRASWNQPFLRRTLLGFVWFFFLHDKFHWFFMKIAKRFQWNSFMFILFTDVWLTSNQFYFSNRRLSSSSWALIPFDKKLLTTIIITGNRKYQKSIVLLLLAANDRDDTNPISRKLFIITRIEQLTQRHRIERKRINLWLFETFEENARITSSINHRTETTDSVETAE